MFKKKGSGIDLKTVLSKLIFIALGTIGLGYLSIYLSVLTSPNDLGQLMFVLLIFLPVLALATGVISEIILRRVLYTIAICMSSFIIIILTKYNQNGLIWIVLYVFLGILGHFGSYLTRFVLRKMKR